MNATQAQKDRTAELFKTPVDEWDNRLDQTCKNVSDRIGWCADVAYETILAWVMNGESDAMTYEQVKAAWKQISALPAPIQALRAQYQAPEMVAGQSAIDWFLYAARLEALIVSMQSGDYREHISFEKKGEQSDQQSDRV